MKEKEKEWTADETLGVQKLIRVPSVPIHGSIERLGVAALAACFSK